MYEEGQGVPQELMDKVWDPFFTTKDKGTGLGLGIVRNIIESHGGGVHIANREPRGARVTIELPAAGPTLALASSSGGWLRRSRTRITTSPAMPASSVPNRRFAC